MFMWHKIFSDMIQSGLDDSGNSWGRKPDLLGNFFDLHVSVKTIFHNKPVFLRKRGDCFSYCFSKLANFGFFIGKCMRVFDKIERRIVIRACSGNWVDRKDCFVNSLSDFSRRNINIARRIALFSGIVFCVFERVPFVTVSQLISYCPPYSRTDVGAVVFFKLFGSFVLNKRLTLATFSTISIYSLIFVWDWLTILLLCSTKTLVSAGFSPHCIKFLYFSVLLVFILLEFWVFRKLYTNSKISATALYKSGGISRFKSTSR